jgi:hypothetical protein
LASDYCNDEVKRAMERHEQGEAWVIPILLRPVDWQNTSFSKLQALPTKGVPITLWRNRDEAFGNVKQGISQIVESFQNQEDSDIRLPRDLILVKSQYQKWIMDNTATFTIPGPSHGISLPIGTAWMELHTLSRKSEVLPHDLETQLSMYHEWERLALQDDVYSAQDTALIGHRVVIVGGPGSGKSTLCRKLAHDSTEFEELVLWVRLPEVASRIGQGMNIHKALIDTATNGFPLSPPSQEALYNNIDCLIADGLDECGPLFPRVAEDLLRWASARQVGPH